MQAVYAEYGVAFTFEFVIPVAGSTNFATDSVGSPLPAEDVRLVLDNGNPVALDVSGTLPTIVQAGSVFWRMTISAAQMTAARISIRIVDQTATKAFVDQAFRILTFGNAAAHIKSNFNGTAGVIPTVGTGLNQIALSSGNVTPSGGSVGSVSGAVGSVTNPVTVGTNSDKGGYALLASEHQAIRTEMDTNSTQLAKLGVPIDFGGGSATLAGNLQDMADDGTETFNRATDSLQAIRDRGDAAWTTGAGGTPPNLIVETTVSGVPTSQTEFVIAAGPENTGAADGQLIRISNATQSTVALIDTYVVTAGPVRTVTLLRDPVDNYTIADGDTVKIIAIHDGLTAKNVAISAGEILTGALVNVSGTLHEVEPTGLPPAPALVGGRLFITEGNGVGGQRRIVGQGGVGGVELTLAQAFNPPAGIGSKYIIISDANVILAQNVTHGGPATIIQSNVTGNVTGNLTGTIGSLGTTAKADVKAEVGSELDGRNATGPRFQNLDNLDVGVGTRASQATADDILTNVPDVLSLANIKTQAVDALATDTYAEPPQEAPLATNSLAQKIGYCFKFLRNKTDQSATLLQIYNDDGVTVDHKASVSSAAGVTTREEIVSGP